MAAKPGNQAAVSRFPVTGCRRRVIRCGHVADRGGRPRLLVDGEGVPAGRGRFSIYEYAERTETALEDPDPWHGFCEYVRGACAMQTGDRGFTEVLTQSFPTAKEFEAERDQHSAGSRWLISRAQETGALRADFVAEDLPMLLMANADVVAFTHDAAREASRRLVAYMLQAFSAETTAPLQHHRHRVACTARCTASNAASATVEGRHPRPARRAQRTSTRYRPLARSQPCPSQCASLWDHRPTAIPGCMEIVGGTSRPSGVSGELGDEALRPA